MKEKEKANENLLAPDLEKTEDKVRYFNENKNRPFLLVT